MSRDFRKNLNRKNGKRRLRLVALADTHLEPVEVPDGDILVHAGDLCCSGSLRELAQAARWLQGLPHPVKLVVAGNHDWCFRLAPERALELLGPGVFYLEDSGVTVHGLRFWGSPWQPEFRGWAFNLPRGAALAAHWACIPADTDVLITHGPPAGVGDRSAAGERTGCADLRACVARLRPRLHLFGHIHEDGGWWASEGTTFVNCTTAAGTREPTVMILELRNGSVNNISLLA